MKRAESMAVRLGLLLSGAAAIPLAFSAGCAPGGPMPQPGPEWKSVLDDLGGGLLSVSGTAATNVIAVGADPGDGLGPLVLHYDGREWTRRESGATGDLWWVSDRIVGSVFFMAGEDGLILSFNPNTELFQEFATPGDETMFGVWGEQENDVVAVGGDVNEPDTSGVIWRFDGTEWTVEDLSGLGEEGVPVLFKVWGRSENEVYAVGGRGTVLRYDGTEWSTVESATTRTLFTVHGNDELVVATGGAQSGVIVESTGGAFADVTPAGTLQMNGVFVPPSGAAVAVGREGAVTLRSEGAWADEDTGLNLDLILDYHAAWVDPDGGIWAVGGNIVGEPRTEGILAYYGERSITSEIDDEE